MQTIQNPPTLSLMTKVGLFFAATMVVILAMAIFWRAATFSHIGVQSTFSLTVLSSDSKFFVSAQNTWPNIGDKILSWNNQPIYSWPMWLDKLESPNLVGGPDLVRLKFQSAKTGEIQEVTIKPATASVGAVRDEPTQPLPPGYTPSIASTVDSST